jgi:hypothetical protein
MPARPQRRSGATSRKGTDAGGPGDNRRPLARWLRGDDYRRRAVLAITEANWSTFMKIILDGMSEKRLSFLCCRSASRTSDRHSTSSQRSRCSVRHKTSRCKSSASNVSFRSTMPRMRRYGPFRDARHVILPSSPLAERAKTPAVRAADRAGVPPPSRRARYQELHGKT